MASHVAYAELRQLLDVQFAVVVHVETYESVSYTHLDVYKRQLDHHYHFDAGKVQAAQMGAATERVAGERLVGPAYHLQLCFQRFGSGGVGSILAG